MQKREVTKKQLAVKHRDAGSRCFIKSVFPGRVKADKGNIKTDSGYAEGDRFAVVVSDTKTDTDA